MYCPKCRSEYREGFTRCSDCDIDLIKELPVESEKIKNEAEYIDYELIMPSVNIRDIVLIKSVLEGENITYFIQGEWGGNLVEGIPARVMVKKDQAVAAKEILNNIDLTQTII